MARQIDFSVIRNIARGEPLAFNAEGREDHTLPATATATASATVADTATAIDAAPPRIMATAASGGDRKAQPFTDTTGTRDYKRLYRAALNFHMNNYPPMIDTAYWRDHSLDDAIPPLEAEYWDRVGDDMIATLREAGESSDKFLIGLIWAIHDEIKREYDRLRQEIRQEAEDQGREAAGGA